MTAEQAPLLRVPDISYLDPSPSDGSAIAQPIARIGTEAGIRSEVLKPNEMLRLVGVNAIVLFHGPGAGGSTLGRSLASSLGAIYYDGGKQVRNATGHSSAHTDFMARDFTQDLTVDEAQTQLMREATPDNPVVINAKLGGLNALKLMLENPDIKVGRILVTCDQEKAAERLFARKLEELSERTKKAIRQAFSSGSPSAEDELLIALAEIEEERHSSSPERELALRRNRIKGDYEHFGQLYPELAGIDIYNPGAMITIGNETDPKTGLALPVKKRLYDIMVSSTKLDKDHLFAEAVTKMIGKGWIKKVRKPRSRMTSKDYGEPIPARPLM